LQLHIGGNLKRLARRWLTSTPMAGLVSILLLLAGSMLASAAKARAQSPHKRSGASSASSATGKLKIFVPVGMVGDDFWIYLNGKLASAPPHGIPETQDRDYVQVPMHRGGIHGSPDGWEIWGKEGRYLAMSNEYFSGLDGLLKGGSTVVQQLFQPVVLPVNPASYSVDLVISSPGNTGASSFPFVVTRKYEMKVRAGETEQVYIAVPDGWNGQVAIAAMPVNRVCPSALSGRPQAPDLDQLQRWMNDYDNDPMVHTLQRAAATQGSRAKKVVVLELPPSQGGSREFDGHQISDIVGSLEFKHGLPTHSEVKECMEQAPQFTRTYTEYDRLLTELDREIERFHRLAGN